MAATLTLTRDELDLLIEMTMITAESKQDELDYSLQEVIDSIRSSEDGHNDLEDALANKLEWFIQQPK